MILYFYTFHAVITMLLSFFAVLLFILAAYLIGSVCSAVIVSQLFHLPDPRLEGSQNPGATNVLRLAGKKYALIVLVADFLKGALPVWLASFCGLSNWGLGLTALAAVLGHIYPLYFNFQGGKGVATTLGVLIAINPVLGGVVIITWLITAYLSHYSSLASLVSAGLAPVYVLLTHSRGAFLPLLIMSIMVMIQHKENIKRLSEGCESKIKLNKT